VSLILNVYCRKRGKSNLDHDTNSCRENTGLPALSEESMDRNDQWGRREWDGPPDSVAVDELGYQSAGALSDGPTFSAALAEYGYNTMRSSGSVGSQGSGERHAAYFRQPVRDMFPHLMNGETRFPTAFSYAASEAPKSDIATVCSGSITEDIEVASILSADYNMAQISNNLLPSPPSSERSALSGNRRTASGGRVEFAALPITAASLGLPGVLARQSALSQDSVMSVVHDMGPPLSRALLLQHPPAPGSSSRPGSVRSFGSTAGACSDVVAHVDTDDCGGSFTDGHSIHSQEDNPADMKVDTEEAAEAQPKDEATNEAAHPLRNGDSSNVPNGRVSPGGTVYRGRGVRRYQGRYMNLPLKRFHQNGVNLCNDGGDHVTNGFSQNGYNDNYDSRVNDHHEYNDRRGRSLSPRRWDGDDRRRSPSPERYSGNAHRRKRYRSRSPPNNSRSRSRDKRSHSGRGRSKTPPRYKSHRSRDRYSRSGDRSHRSESPRHKRRSRNVMRSSSR